MRYLALILVCFFCCAAQAQYNDIGYFRKAEQLYQLRDYYAAQQYYERYLTVDKRSRAYAQPFAVQKKSKTGSNLNPRQEAIYHLANCYWQQHDYLRAESGFRQACSFPRRAYQESPYWYGKTLIANGHYKEALEIFAAFVKEYTQMGPVLIDADRQLDNLRFIQAQLTTADRHAFRLQKQSVPGITSTYAPALWKDSLVFTAIKPVQSPIAGKTVTELQYRNELYTVLSPAAADSQALLPAHPFGALSDTVLHNGLATFSPDGRHMFFTRWTKENGVSRGAIWIRTKLDTGWSAPVMAGDPLNVDGYTSTQPFATADGKYLLFASDRPGGQGSYDLWFAGLDSGFKVLSVSNLGEKINSPGDEGSPYYHQNSRTLVFSSNGRVGMGGWDIYYSHGFFDLSQWQVPENPGLPLNSSRDDAYFISTDEDNLWNTGWMSSDRDGSCCLVLYSVAQDNTQYISGSVLDCEAGRPLRNARLTVTDEHHPERVLAQPETDSTGHYRFHLKNISRYRIHTAKEGYVDEETPFLVHMKMGSDTITNNDLCLRRVPLPADQRLHILGNFPYKKSALPVAAYRVMDSLVAVLKDHSGYSLLVDGYTDGIGGEKYNIRLARARVDACIRYMVKMGIDPSRLHGRSFGKCCPIAPDTIDGRDNPAGRELNRRVEFKVLQ